MAPVLGPAKPDPGTTPWPRRSTDSTKPNSSTGGARGVHWKRSKRPPWNGSTGSITAASSSRSRPSRRPRPKRDTAQIWIYPVSPRNTQINPASRIVGAAKTPAGQQPPPRRDEAGPPAGQAASHPSHGARDSRTASHGAGRAVSDPCASPMRRSPQAGARPLAPTRSRDGRVRRPARENTLPYDHLTGLKTHGLKDRYLDKARSFASLALTGPQPDQADP